MKVFLSWSGTRSRFVAEALNAWLPRVIQAVKPFYSPGLEKGARWDSEVDKALEGTRFGIICLTPDNLESVWIHYEAGALAKTEGALIWTFLHGLTSTDVPPPLGKFQHTMAEKGDVLRLLETINRRLVGEEGEPLDARFLEENFEYFWPILEAKLIEAENLTDDDASRPHIDAGKSLRGENAKLDEILDLVRSQERRLLRIEDTVSALRSGGRTPREPADEVYYHDISVTITPKAGTDTEAIARSIATELERLEPLARIAINEFGTIRHVVVNFPELISRSKARALVEALGRRVNYEIGGWGGTPVF